VNSKSYRNSLKYSGIAGEHAPRGVGLGSESASLLQTFKNAF